MKKAIIATVVGLLIISVAVLADPPSSGNGPNCPYGLGQGQGPGLGMRQGMGGRWMDGGMGRGMAGMRGGAMGRLGRGMGGHAGMGIAMILAHADDLQLTDAQKTQLETMTAQFQMDRVDKEAALEKAEIQLRSLMTKGDASQKDMDAAIDNVASMRAAIQKMQYAHLLKAKGVLTADQITKLKDMRKNFGRGSRMGNWRHGNTPDAPDQPDESQ